MGLLVKRKFCQTLICPFAQSLRWGALYSILGMEALLLGRAEQSIPSARKGRAVRRAGLTAKARAEQ